MKKYSALIFNLVFFLLGVLLLYLAFYRQDRDRIWQEIQKVDFRWGIIILIISYLNHLIRAARWRMLTKTLQFNYSVHSLFWALMFGYLVNLAIPRLGEISRCLVLSRNEEKKNFMPLLGTVFTERVIDMLSFFMVILLAFLFHFKLLKDFIENNLLSPIQQGIFETRQLLYIFLFLGAFMALGVWLWRKKIGQIYQHNPGTVFISRFIAGVQTILKMRQIGLFLVYTCLIWLSYFLMTYLWFFSIPATSHLDPRAGLALLAIGSFARLVPTQGGGLGAYQLLVSKGFVWLGVAEVYGATLAIIIHATQLIFTLLMGGLAPVYFLLKRKNQPIFTPFPK